MVTRQAQVHFFECDVCESEFSNTCVKYRLERRNIILVAGV
jgi:hypothetical protein